MDYFKNFYRAINTIINPRPPFRTNYSYKPIYFIKNRYHQPFPIDEFDIFDPTKYYKPKISEEKKEEKEEELM